MAERPKSPTVHEPGRTLAYWLAEACADARIKAGAKLYDIAVLVRRDDRTVRRFEKGDHIPNDLERWLAAYAQVANIPDPRDLLADALARWHKYGRPPRPPDVPSSRGNGTALHEQHHA